MKFIKSIVVSAGFCFILSAPVMAGAYTLTGVKLFEVKSNIYNNCFIGYTNKGRNYYVMWKCPSTNGDSILNLATAAYFSGLKIDITLSSKGADELIALALNQG